MGPGLGLSANPGMGEGTRSRVSLTLARDEEQCWEKRVGARAPWQPVGESNPSFQVENLTS